MHKKITLFRPDPKPLESDLLYIFTFGMRLADSRAQKIKVL